MKILIADKLSEKAITQLKEMGATVVVNPSLNSGDLPGALQEIEILVVRSTKVTAEAINSATSLSLIIRAGAGVNTIDLKEASNRGIHVANCPGKNTEAVAELAIGLLISADRRIPDATRDLRDGKWKKKEYAKARGLKGRKLGIVGLGSIGRAVAKRAKGLEMNVIAWSRSLTREKADNLDIGYCESPGDLAELSDAVSIHLAANAETKHLLGKEFFEKMKEGAILINTSRGQVVDTVALINAIREKDLRVGLDVYENEPPAGDPEFPLKELANMTFCTPHIGASTMQASEAVAAEVVRIVKSYKNRGKPVHAVNIRAKTSAVINLIIRHFNHVGVLAGVLDELRNEGVNIEEMENTIFEGGLTASCTLKLDEKPSGKMIKKLQRNKDIIQVMLK
jgi:D-3-phosphoglycerate dehydrogenase / 2-oxoglutarate reductase